MKRDTLALHVGVKTDPVEYRYSYAWLFKLMAEEGVFHAQLGSFFELYQLPDDYFVQLKNEAAACGVTISSIFTAHRELGGFFRFEHPAWAEVTRRNYRRLIQIAALLQVRCVGSNAGAVLRDQMHHKQEGMQRYLEFMHEMQAYAHQCGVTCLTIEPMSCLAEPPTLPAELHAVAQTLLDYHRQHPDSTATVGYCTDVSHGHADRDGQVQWDNMQLLAESLPYLREVHLKNTDAIFNATFGFSAEERARGIVDIPAVVELLQNQAAKIPVPEIVGYLEINGPKFGRDYTDFKLEPMLRESLRYLREAFTVTPQPAHLPAGGA